MSTQTARREGGALSCAPSADAVAGNGGPLSWAPSADAVAGRGHNALEFIELGGVPPQHFGAFVLRYALKTLGDTVAGRWPR